MRFLYTIIFCLSGGFYLYAQCSNPVAQIDLDVNDATVRLLTGGDFWWDGSDAKYLYQVDESTLSQASTVFSSGLWMGGIDDGGNIKVAAQQYGRSTGNFDYVAGPITPDSPNADLCAQWDRFFVIEAAEIRAAQLEFQANGSVPEDNLTSNLKSWPAVGNPFFAQETGFELGNQSPLAPFHDEDNNGSYDPTQGDYPLVCGEKAIWYVFNDLTNHEESGGEPLGVEVQVLAYAYRADEPPYQTTTFYDFKIINRSGVRINDFRVGQFVDFDLGCFENDLLGSDPDRNMIFVHNNSPVEPASCQFGVTSFEDRSPIQALKILGTNVPANSPDQPQYRFISFNNLAVGAPMVATSDPSSPIEYYNYLNGRWLDGVPLTIGGEGYNLNNSDTTSFAFGGQMDGQVPWYECTAGLPVRDRRAVFSLGIDTYFPGQVLSYTTAAITAFDTPIDGGCADLETIRAYADEIQADWETMSCAVAPNAVEDRVDEKTVSVYPNPATDKVTFNVQDESNVRIESIQLFNAHGSIVRELDANVRTVTLQRLDLSAGIYWYRLRMSNGKWTSGKVVF